MKKQLAYSSIILMTTLPLSGCGPDGSSGFEEDDTTETSMAVVRNNAIGLNGIGINGVHLNGVHLNGVHLNGVHLNGVELNGAELTGTREDDNMTVSSSGFTGSTMEATLGDASQVTLTVVSIEEAGTGEADRFEVTYDAGGTPTNICGSSGARAILLDGSWDYATGTHVDDSTKMTFACEGAALAKCAAWGYKPWVDHEECVGGTCVTVTGGALHEACTRMVRADYCGNGVAHTRDGTTIDVYDNGHAMAQASNTGLTLEAEWSPSGAVCVKHSRWTKLDGTDPDKAHVLLNCGSAWQPTTCGGASSTFPTTLANLAVSLEARALLRNDSALDNKD